MARSSLKRARAGNVNAWSAAEVVALQEALAVVRPSAPGFWQQVASIVGRSAEACQAQAFHGNVAEFEVRSPSPKASRKRARKSPRKGGATYENLQENIPDNIAAPTVDILALPKSHGPVRARRINQFLTQHSRAESHDFFPAADVVRDRPHGLDESFLASMGRTPLAELALDCTPGFRKEPGAPVEALGGLGLQLADHSFQPMGIESFICRMQQSGRGPRAAMKVVGASLGSRKRPARRDELARAEALFRKVDGHVGAGTEVEEESDDEDAAPLAFIPCCASP